jgi:hypothetical protein
VDWGARQDKKVKMGVKLGHSLRAVDTLQQSRQMSIGGLRLFGVFGALIVSDESAHRHFAGTSFRAVPGQCALLL